MIKKTTLKFQENSQKIKIYSLETLVRGVFRTLWNTYDKEFLRIESKAKRCSLYPQSSTIIDVWQGPKYTTAMEHFRFV